MKKLVISVLIVASVVFLGALKYHYVNASSGFVTTKGQNFYLDGQRFKSIGVNRYNLLTIGGNPFVGCGGTFTTDQLNTWFGELSQMGVTSVRFWLFQSFTKSGTYFDRFNYVLSLANQYNIKVVPVFENQRGDCTQGGYKDSTWYKSGYQHPYGTYPISLKDYIGKVVPIYKNNPQILMWQIMNEAEDYDTTGFYNFAKDTSGYIKSLDSNHIVSFGTMGSGQPGSSVYKKIHSLPTIDVLEYHDYNSESTPFPASLGRRFNDAASLNKPLFIGESGISLNKFSPAVRAGYFDAKISTYFQHGGSLYMIWSYRDATDREQSYNFDLSDPLVAVVEKYTKGVSTPLNIANASTVSPTLTSSIQQPSSSTTSGESSPSGVLGATSHIKSFIDKLSNRLNYIIEIVFQMLRFR